jgi:hypothetical protein
MGFVVKFVVGGVHDPSNAHEGFRVRGREERR